MNILLRMKRTLSRQYGVALVNELLNKCSNDILQVEHCLTDCYRGVYQSELEFTYKFLDQFGFDKLPSITQRFIDYQGFCDALFFDDYFSIVIGEEVHVFAGH